MKGNTNYVHGARAANSSLATAQGKKPGNMAIPVQTIISTSSSSTLNYRLTLILKAGNEQDNGGDKGEEKDNEATYQASTLMT
jgi:hypothetical protein